MALESGEDPALALTLVSRGAMSDDNTTPMYNFDGNPY